ncbi:MAG: class II aldolase/adducin family protein [Gemmatimonadetes bacterium]|nr:class II aldolase/adducin family protein [Gemmatimonadota bacterium]
MVCTICRRLYERGLIAGQDGNVSVRLGEDAVLVTPAGLSKVDLCPEDLVELGLDGTVRHGTRRPTSEVAVHLRAYQRRADVRAVVHAHPPIATAFSLVGETVDSAALAEVRYGVGPVALVPYGTPSTDAAADVFDPFWTSHDAFLMAHHGALTVGATLTKAHQRMESLENGARIMWIARSLGHPRALPNEALAALDLLRATSRNSEEESPR